MVSIGYAPELLCKANRTTGVNSVTGGITGPPCSWGIPQRQDSNFEKTTFGQKVISGHKSQSGLDTLTY
jgi:hypothetical protein